MSALLPRALSPAATAGILPTAAHTSAPDGSTRSCLCSSSLQLVPAFGALCVSRCAHAHPAPAYLGGGLLYNVKRLGMPLEKESLPHYVFWTEFLPELVREVISRRSPMPFAATQLAAGHHVYHPHRQRVICCATARSLRPVVVLFVVLWALTHANRNQFIAFCCRVSAALFLRRVNAAASWSCSRLVAHSSPPSL
jgi:hypothetical protein